MEYRELSHYQRNTMNELQNLVRMQEEANRPVPPPTRRQEQEPRRNVRQLVQYFEANPIPPYRPIPAFFAKVPGVLNRMISHTPLKNLNICYC